MNDNSPTVDKIIFEKGYMLDNIAIICWRCNAIKGSATIKELNLLYNWMVNYVKI